MNELESSDDTRERTAFQADIAKEIGGTPPGARDEKAPGPGVLYRQRVVAWEKEPVWIGRSGDIDLGSVRFSSNREAYRATVEARCDGERLHLQQGNNRSGRIVVNAPGLNETHAEELVPWEGWCDPDSGLPPAEELVRHSALQIDTRSVFIHLPDLLLALTLTWEVTEEPVTIRRPCSAHEITAVPMTAEIRRRSGLPLQEKTVKFMIVDEYLQQIGTTDRYVVRILKRLEQDGTDLRRAKAEPVGHDERASEAIRGQSEAPGIRCALDGGVLSQAPAPVQHARRADSERRETLSRNADGAVANSKSKLLRLSSDTWRAPTPYQRVGESRRDSHGVRNPRNGGRKNGTCPVACCGDRGGVGALAALARNRGAAWEKLAGTVQRLHARVAPIDFDRGLDQRVADSGPQVALGGDSSRHDPRFGDGPAWCELAPHGRTGRQHGGDRHGARCSAHGSAVCARGRPRPDRGAARTDIGFDGIAVSVGPRHGGLGPTPMPKRENVTIAEVAPDAGHARIAGGPADHEGTPELWAQARYRLLDWAAELRPRVAGVDGRAVAHVRASGAELYTEDRCWSGIELDRGACCLDDIQATKVAELRDGDKLS